MVHNFYSVSVRHILINDEPEEAAIYFHYIHSKLSLILMLIINTISNQLYSKFKNLDKNKKFLKKLQTSYNNLHVCQLNYLNVRYGH